MSLIGPHNNGSGLVLSGPQLRPRKKEVAHVKLRGDRGVAKRVSDSRALAGGGVLVPLDALHRPGQRGGARPFTNASARSAFPSASGSTPTCSHWDTYWHTTLDTTNPPFWKWFVGGRLNASYNCVDRHLATKANKAAFIWVPEPETEGTKAITYQELYRRVNEFAAMLKGFCGLRAATG